MNQQELNRILDAHEAWFRGEGGERADLSFCDLSGLDLRGRDLDGANLRGAKLTGATLVRANLHDANLHGAYLGGATLVRANLTRADLTGANLADAILVRANLAEAKLPHHDLPDGELIAWKRCLDDLVQLRIPRDARRVMPLTSRKCRAEWAEVVWIEGERSEAKSEHGGLYSVGERVVPDKYDPDPRVACSHGIHFFLTRAEAEE